MTTVGPTKPETAAPQEAPAADQASLQQVTLPSDQTGRLRAQWEQSLPPRATAEDKIASMQKTKQILETYYRDKWATPAIRTREFDKDVVKLGGDQTNETTNTIPADQLSTPSRYLNQGYAPNLPKDMTAQLDKFFSDRKLAYPLYINSGIVADGPGSWVEIEDRWGEYARKLLQGQDSIELDGFKIEKVTGQKALKMTYLKKVAQVETDIRAGGADLPKEQSQAMSITGLRAEDFAEPGHYSALLFSGERAFLRKDVAMKFDGLFDGKNKPKILQSKHVAGGGAGTEIVVEDANGEYKSLVGKTQDFEITRHDGKKTLTITYINPAPYERKVPSDLNTIKDPEIRDWVKKTNKPPEDFQRIGSSRGIFDLMDLPPSYVLSYDVAQSFRRLVHNVSTPKVLEVRMSADADKGTTLLLEDANREYTLTFLNNRPAATVGDFRVEAVTTRNGKPGVRLTYLGKQPPKQQ